MDSKRYGRQTPTRERILSYSQSRGSEAVEIYDRSGRTALPWQQLLIEDIMAVNSEGLWVHMKFGWSVPRRNGKSETAIMRSVWAVSHGERTLYTAHRTTTSHNAWEKVIDCLTKAGFTEGEDFKTTKQYGLEHIEWLTGGGVINFRTRSTKGGLGEGYDLLIIDEAQEYTADQETALKYLVTDSANPQTLMCGTPPTVVSSGTVFMNYRKETMTNGTPDCGWAEWSVNELCDPENVEHWYETNPSLGYILTERTIRAELGDNIDFNIQRLGLWLQYNQKSAISREEWRRCEVAKPPALPSQPRVFYGVKYAKRLPNVSMAAAVRTADGRIFVEAVGCRPARDGNDWLMPFLRSKSAVKVVIDGAGNQNILAEDMKNAGVKCKPILPKVADVVEAAAVFERDLFSDKLIHSPQPALEQAAANCEHRPIGANGGFGYVSILEGADISLLEAVVLAYWACAGAKEPKKQLVRF